MCVMVSFSTLGKFDNWSSAFWTKFESQIKDVENLSDDEVSTSIFEKVIELKELMVKIVNKESLGDRTVSSSILDSIKKMAASASDQEIKMIISSTSIFYRAQMLVLLMYLEENIFSKAYDEMKNEMFAILEKLNSIEEKTGREKTIVS